MEFHDLSEYIQTSKAAIDLLKAAIGLLPKSGNRDEAALKIAAAEDMLKRSDAKLAKSLGFQLCKCKFPPPIMLWRKDERATVCPKCGDKIQEPKVVTQNPRGSWPNHRRGKGGGEND